MLAIAREDPVCRQLMRVPGVGAVVAITFKSGVAAYRGRQLNGWHAFPSRVDRLDHLACPQLLSSGWLLGHSKIETTVRYLGVEVEDALTLAEATEL